MKMADVLLNKIINDDIKVELFIRWLLKTNTRGQYLDIFKDYKCSQTDFLTYFLNFVHEEIPCQNRYGDTSQKTSISKRADSKENEKTLLRNMDTGIEKIDINKSASYPLSLNKSFENSDVCLDSPVAYHMTSTPKVLRIQSENNLTNGYTNPVSPLYRSCNSFSTPKTKAQMNGMQSSMEKTSPLCLGDFIVNKKHSTKKKASRNLLANELTDESSKRIKPTSLSQVKVNNSFRKTKNSFNNFNNTKEVSVESVDESRSFLAEERLKILSRKDSSDNLVAAASMKIGTLVSLKTEVEPNICSITNKAQLDCLVEIYVCILKNNFVLNINSEMYFLISLLLSKQFIFKEAIDDFQMGIDYLNEEDKNVMQNMTRGAGKSVCCVDLFETIHNTVYFAAKCLESQANVLIHYDKSTLKLLSRNKRLRMFSNSFADKLAKIAERKSERILEIIDDHQQINVCFNLDTDNRPNFPNDVAFHTFRKQRDLFYEILTIWENSHLLSGWSFAVALGGKIKGLFSLQSEPANFMHFSRLFKAQLLSTCRKTQKEEGLTENQLPFLSSLPNVDSDKLNRLKSRLVTKQSSSGINCQPAFIGYQEFYKEFIIAASNYAFNKHLCDTLISEIVELNNSKFSCSDLDESDVAVAPSTQKAYVTCLKSLKILGKFLGFIESLPYKSECNVYTEHQLTTHLSVRAEIIPSFDVKYLLIDSLKQHSLVLTIPWITEYVSMLDYVTLRLPYYISFCEILFDIYKNYEAKAPAAKSSYSYGTCLVKFCLGWLFEQPHFPDSEYFNFCTGATKGDIQLIQTTVSGQKGQKTKSKAMDDMPIIDQNVLYICCPYLDEIKKLLSSNAMHNSVTIKHITPVTAVQSSSEITKKRLEQQLEEAFFSGQPVSIRKTVEFVSERVASTCVKYICNTVVPNFKYSALEQLRSFLASWKAEYSVMFPIKEKSHKASLRTKVGQMAQNSLKSLKDTCETEVASITQEKIPTAIDSLLAIDVLPQTKDVCTAITMKICIDRVKQWINSHVTLSVFTKEFDSELQKIFIVDNKKVKDKPSFLLPSGGNGKKHNDASTSAFHLVEKIRGFSMDILENSASVTESVVLNLLQECCITLTERCDVNESITAYIGVYLVDFALLLIAHNSDVLSKEVLTRFVELWKHHCGKTDNLFKNLLCLRNTMLLAQACNEAIAWEAFASFVAFLIKEGMLDCDNFESQCTGFFKKDWDEGSLRNFTTFLNKFLECYRHDGGNVDKFTFLLQFLSDFCSDL